MKIGKIEITKDHLTKGFWVYNDGEGMLFSEEELEKMFKEILYKHF